MVKTERVWMEFMTMQDVEYITSSQIFVQFVTN